MRTNAGLSSLKVSIGIILFLGGPSVGNDMSSRWRPYNRDFTPPVVILRNKEISEFSTHGGSNDRIFDGSVVLGGKGMTTSSMVDHAN